MNNLNYLLIEGHLCHDPVMKEAIPGRSVCKFTIAVNRSFVEKGKENKNVYLTETSFFPVDVWGKLGELCKRYLVQGRGIRIVGHLKQQRWKIGETEYRQSVVIVAEHIEFMPEHKRLSDTPLDNESKDVIQTNESLTPKETTPPEDLSEEQVEEMIETDPEMQPQEEN